MWSILFFVLMIGVFGKLLGFAIRAAWGVSKIIVNLILLPLFLVGLVLKGLFSIAFSILIVVGIISLFGLRD